MEEAFYVSRKKYEALVNELKDLKTLKAGRMNTVLKSILKMKIHCLMNIAGTTTARRSRII